MPLLNHLTMFSPNVLLKLNVHFCLLKFLVFSSFVFCVMALLRLFTNFKYKLIFATSIPNNLHNPNFPLFKLLSLQ